MKFSAPRETILKPLQAVIGVVERRQTMPILANVLLQVGDGRLRITATDLEVELVAGVDLEVEQEGEITVPGRKLLEICRALPEGATVKVELAGDRLTVRSGRSRFTLSTLPAADFPLVESVGAAERIRLAQAAMRRLVERTHFSMAQQDVRYYLNGMLLETRDGLLRAVATDGHRLAMCETALADGSGPDRQVIVPRKGVLELQRLLDGDSEMEVAIGRSHVQVDLGDIRFTSKLIDGRFPEYSRVIPGETDNIVKADRELLRRALQRTAILSNEKYRGIRLTLSEGLLTIQAHNPEQEEAEEQVEVEYGGDALEIGFNVTYLLDALGVIDEDSVEVGLVDANSSCLIRAPESDDSRFVVMPMRL